MELIDKNVLKQEIINVYEYEYPCATGEFDKFVTQIIPNIINNIPIIDAESVRYAHWVLIWAGRDVEQYACSHCGGQIWAARSREKYRFCPHCGAIMNSEVGYDSI